MTAAFDGPVLDRLREAIEVRIETRPGYGGAVHRAIVWIVVDDHGRALVRSWRGATARWYREATRGGEVALIVGSDRVAVRAIAATDPDRVAACSEALERKYAGDPAVRSMVREEILDTTLELVPA